MAFSALIGLIIWILLVIICNKDAFPCFMFFLAISFFEFIAISIIYSEYHPELSINKNKTEYCHTFMTGKTGHIKCITVTEDD
jgi:hypothetical protein